MESMIQRTKAEHIKYELKYYSSVFKIFSFPMFQVLVIGFYDQRVQPNKKMFIIT